MFRALPAGNIDSSANYSVSEDGALYFVGSKWYHIRGAAETGKDRHSGLSSSEFNSFERKNEERLTESAVVHKLINIHDENARRCHTAAIRKYMRNVGWAPFYHTFYKLRIGSSNIYMFWSIKNGLSDITFHICRKCQNIDELVFGL